MNFIDSIISAPSFMYYIIGAQICFMIFYLLSLVFSRFLDDMDWAHKFNKGEIQISLYEWRQRSFQKGL